MTPKGQKRQNHCCCALSAQGMPVHALQKHLQRERWRSQTVPCNIQHVFQYYIKIHKNPINTFMVMWKNDYIFPLEALKPWGTTHFREPHFYPLSLLFVAQVTHEMPQAAEVWPLVAMNCCLRSVTPATPVTATVSDSTTLEAEMYRNVHLLTIINAQSSRHWHVFSNFLNLSGAVVTCCAEICRPNVFNWKSICWNHICNWPILTLYLREPGHGFTAVTASMIFDRWGHLP